LKALSAADDPPQRLAAVTDFDVFRSELDTAWALPNRSKGRPPNYLVLMFNVLVLQTL